MKRTRRQFLQSVTLASAATFMDLRARAAGPLNEVALDLEPSPQHPRLSEGAFVTLKSGTIIFIFTRFCGGAADHSPADLVRIDSNDGGRTWNPEQRLVVENPGAGNVMSVSLLRLRSGRIALFYLVKHNLLDCRPVVRFSDDEAQTWSDPIAVTTAPGYFVLNNDRVIQLESGRLIVPLALHRSRGNDPNSYKQWDSRGIAVWCLSDDDGKTWREADDWWALPVRSTTGLQEPGVVEIASGRLFSWARTDQGAQFGCTSNDGGVHWTPPEGTELASPVSPASIKRLPGSNELLALYNDHSGKFEFPKGKRTPLVAALSADGGKTWPRRRLLETDAEGWFCYTAIHFTDDAVLLAYCAGDPKVGRLNRTRIRRVSLEWLKSG